MDNQWQMAQLGLHCGREHHPENAVEHAKQRFGMLASTIAHKQRELESLVKEYETLAKMLKVIE